jgi:hypothetical protein
MRKFLEKIMSFPQSLSHQNSVLRFTVKVSTHACSLFSRLYTIYDAHEQKITLIEVYISTGTNSFTDTISFTKRLYQSVDCFLFIAPVLPPKLTLYCRSRFRFK